MVFLCVFYLPNVPCRTRSRGRSLSFPRSLSASPPLHSPGRAHDPGQNQHGNPTENLHSTFQGLVTGVHMGFGYGLGAVMGGIIYATFGARRCFGLGTMLPSLSLTLLSLHTVRQWCSQNAARSQELDKCAIIAKVEYELVDEVSPNSASIRLRLAWLVLAWFRSGCMDRVGWFAYVGLCLIGSSSLDCGYP